MELHPYARARAAYTQAEEVLVRTAVQEALWPQHQVRRIITELHEDAAVVDREAEVLWGALKARGMAEHSGVRLLLAQDGRLLLENASRAHGSPKAATPSCITCGGLMGDILCEACVALHRPPASPLERTHREHVRAYLAKETGASTEPTWAFLLKLVAAHRPDLAQLLSRATPLRLHRSGYFCATADSDETCQALMCHSREVELLLVEHGVPALGYRMGVGWEAGMGDPAPLLTCDSLHLP